MKTFLLLISFSLSIILISSTNPTSPPVWPNQFEQSFTETFTYPIIGSHTTKGKIYYDYTQRRYRIDRENGRYDRYCGPIHPLSNTSCSQYVSNGDRYIHYPELNECCYCCSSDHGCGVLKPDWLNGASYVGIVEVDNVKLEKWNKKGLNDNFYYATVEGRVMQRIDQQPIDDQVYDIKSFYPGISHQSKLELPGICKKENTCPYLSVCTALRSHSKLSFLQ